MLVNLINNRVTTDSQQSSRGFQLIVITHDLRLVENLYRDCKPECVYGLSKDAYGVSRMKRYTHFELTN
uniref:ABC transporter ATP-binding protein n=1 Tax=Steinernema glaseri TaxID=37863 RepID=A0A1I7ZZ51_9BILA